MNRETDRPCPTPGKTGFRLRADAENVRRHPRQRVFHCPCGFWHVVGPGTHQDWRVFR